MSMSLARLFRDTRKGLYHSLVIVASNCFPSNEADSSLITADAVKRSMTGRARHSTEVVKGAPTVLTLRSH